jgi:hypothetical protein
MATEVQGRYAEEHWTAKPEVKVAAVLAAVLVPWVGLAFVVPCLVGARRTGTKSTAYVIAVAIGLLWVLFTVLSFLAATMIAPVDAGPHPV